MASDVKNATKPLISFLANTSIASARRCLISSRRVVAEMEDLECVPPACLGSTGGGGGQHRRIYSNCHCLIIG